MPTFGRLKQTCSDFNRYLVEFHELVKIRQYYETDEMNPPLQAMETMFPACAMRLKHQLERVVGKEIDCDSVHSVQIRYDQFCSRRSPWWHIGATVQVKYPFGYICKKNEPKKPRGHIFQSNPMDCFTVIFGFPLLTSVKRMTEEQKKIRKRLIKLN